MSDDSCSVCSSVHGNCTLPTVVILHILSCCSEKTTIHSPRKHDLASITRLRQISGYKCRTECVRRIGWLRSWRSCRGGLKRSAVVFASCCNTDASGNRLVSCALLTYESSLTIRIRITISFTKAEREVLSGTSIISLQPCSVRSGTHGAEVCTRRCASCASRHRFVSTSLEANQVACTLSIIVTISLALGKRSRRSTTASEHNLER
mmetsp:Transcript_5680/g.8242  ORF Transcript_5680/g.8242 Transcript_5680/m.8242 type:complete len:207 (+) Transcript_5680:873-1493(+)